MSIRWMTWAFEQSLAPNRKIVLLALADWAGDDGRCWPSQRSIGEKASMHPGTVRRHLAELEAAGYLTRTHRGSEAGGRSSDLVELHWEPDLARDPRANPAEVGARNPGVGAHPARGLARDGARGTVSEPLEEPSTPAAPPRETDDGILGVGPPVEPVEVVAAEEEPLARRVVNRYWETCDPKPVTRWIALVKLTERFLDAGWSPRAVLWALGNARAHTIAAMEFALRQVVLPDADRGAAILAAAKRP
jgi:hypothetical protein